MHGNLTKPRSIERIFLNSCFIRVVFSMLYVIRFNNNTNNNRKNNNNNNNNYMLGRKAFRLRVNFEKISAAE